MEAIQTLENYILNYLEEHLNPLLVYHSVGHTENVVQEVKQICDYEGISSTKKNLIVFAAYCHDIGFVTRIVNNEQFGAQFAEKLMRQKGNGIEEIEFVKMLILESNLSKACTSFESGILRDADLGYFGTKEFFIGSQKLYQEYVNFGRISGNESEWLEKQIEFFKTHNYYSAYSNKYRLPVKELNLLKLIKRLEELS